MTYGTVLDHNSRAASCILHMHRRSTFGLGSAYCAGRCSDRCAPQVPYGRLWIAREEIIACSYRTSSRTVLA
jgi:hypothetical protein